ncbi:MAG: tRNA (adenosine(37)-N6)-threonylcarbamoyltransferase complex dimerization subunit type 1 TsaB [Hyphomicrobiaceae bacterium]|nr:tRNA (adenosine(37)-N6)-threonylcarbamoyltransferase complex dimerization subunit type 1 TsaB [Hyphomicrobiaceae bacterium]
MNVLALDTTLGACSAAVARGEPDAPDTTGAFELREREHAEAIIPMIEHVLTDAGIGYEDLDAIAVTTGPGSFTGVRVGIATARGLALALDLPLIGATSLEVMARKALEKINDAPDVLGVVVDARRGQVYMAVFDGSGSTRSVPEALTPERAVTRLPEGGHTVLVGGGAELVRQASADPKALQVVLPDLQPDAQMLARMAMTRTPEREPLRPLYLRPPDAKPQSGKAIPRRD